MKCQCSTRDHRANIWWVIVKGSMEVVCSVSAVNSMNTPVFLFFFNSNSQCMTMIRPAWLVWWKWKRLHSSRGHPHTWHLTIKCWAPWPGLSGVRVQLIFSPTSRIIEFPDTWKLRKIEKKKHGRASVPEDQDWDPMVYKNRQLEAVLYSTCFPLRHSNGPQDFSLKWLKWNPAGFFST